jgi:hypothetical protein
MMSINPDQLLLKIYIVTSNGAKILQAICDENMQQTSCVPSLAI